MQCCTILSTNVLLWWSMMQQYAAAFLPLSHVTARACLLLQNSATQQAGISPRPLLVKVLFSSVPRPLDSLFCLPGCSLCALLDMLSALLKGLPRLLRLALQLV